LHRIHSRHLYREYLLKNWIEHLGYSSFILWDEPEIVLTEILNAVNDLQGQPMQVQHSTKNVTNASELTEQVH
jgi:hypothetical protein